MPTDGDLVRVERRRRRPRARPLPPEPDALLEAARLQILRGGRGAALAGVWELSRYDRSEGSVICVKIL